MIRNAFLKTMIEVLKYDNLDKKIRDREQLLRMLSRAKINFVSKYGFTNHGRLNQHWEVVELRFPVPLLGVAEEYKKELDFIVKYVYEEFYDYKLHHMEIRPQVIEAPEEVTEYDVVFDKIQNTVIQGIRDATLIIWAVVAWFSKDAFIRNF